MAAIRALEARSLEFMHEKEEKKRLEQRIAMLMGQMIRGERSPGDGSNGVSSVWFSDSSLVVCSITPCATLAFAFTSLFLPSHYQTISFYYLMHACSPLQPASVRDDGGHGPEVQVMMKQQQDQLRREYEGKLADLERERETIGRAH